MNLRRWLSAAMHCRRQWAIWLAIAALVGTSEAAMSQDARVFISNIDGPIGVASTRQIERAIERAQAENAIALIVRLDTPGGLVSSTREMIKQFVASPVPIIVYVAPSGARAASAGTFLVYAANIAAMAPGTNIGAATPIEIGGVPGLPQPRSNEPSKDEKGGSTSQQQPAAERKAVNDVVALIRSLAQLRGRNAEWAEKAVREAATLTAIEAKKENVVDYVAVSIEDLLNQVDGRKVTVAGVEKTLATKGAKTEIVEPDIRTRALSAISNPNVAFILLMIGFYGLILEFWHPGTFVPGVIGGISLILALVALTALPVNFGALGLLVLGLALMIGEAFTPGVGVLGIGGLAAFLVGSYFLFEDAGGEIAVSLPLILGMAATTALMTFGVAGVAMQARRRPAITGAEQIIGVQGHVVEWQALSGQVRVLGEIWQARSTQPLRAGDPVQVVGREGLVLVVRQ